MKVELDRDDIEGILIAHVAEKFGPLFNSITWAGYTYPRSAMIEHEEPEEKKPEEPA
jgi:hypothetical protein